MWRVEPVVDNLPMALQFRGHHVLDHTVLGNTRGVKGVRGIRSHMGGMTAYLAPACGRALQSPVSVAATGPSGDAAGLFLRAPCLPPRRAAPKEVLRIQAVLPRPAVVSRGRRGQSAPCPCTAASRLRYPRRPAVRPHRRHREAACRAGPLPRRRPRRCSSGGASQGLLGAPTSGGAAARQRALAPSLLRCLPLLSDTQRAQRALLTPARVQHRLRDAGKCGDHSLTCSGGASGINCQRSVLGTARAGLLHSSHNRTAAACGWRCHRLQATQQARQVPHPGGKGAPDVRAGSPSP